MCIFFQNNYISKTQQFIVYLILVSLISCTESTNADKKEIKKTMIATSNALGNVSISIDSICKNNHVIYYSIDTFAPPPSMYSGEEIYNKKVKFDGKYFIQVNGENINDTLALIEDDKYLVKSKNSVVRIKLTPKRFKEYNDKAYAVLVYSPDKGITGIYIYDETKETIDMSSKPIIVFPLGNIFIEDIDTNKVKIIPQRSNSLIM